MEDEDVILIPSPTKNQDGSQTFYILDPCPSVEESTDVQREFELIDLTAEVQNTGTIAVLSTNSNTGTFEITLTKKEHSLKVEEMDSTTDTDQVQLNDTSADVGKESLDDMIVDDELGVSTIKDEDEDVDVEEVSIHEIHIENNCTDQRSESDSMTFGTDEENKLTQNDQDDDLEEGVLYIDDEKYSELQEEFTQEVSEDNEDVKEMVIEESESSPKNPTKESSFEDISAEVINVLTGNNNSSSEGVIVAEEILASTEEPDTSTKEIQTQQVQNSTEEMKAPMDLEKIKHVVVQQMKEETCEQVQQYVQESTVADKEIVNDEAVGQEAFIHGHLIQIPTKMQCFPQKSVENASCESKNTALTLLELAGGTSYRSDVGTVDEEMEIIELRQDVISPSVQFVSSDEPQLTPELTTLTTLQPVPIDTSNSSSCIEVPSVLNRDSAPQIRPEVPSTPKLLSNVKISSDLVQRLMEGDTPMLGTRGPKAQYKHLTSPIVTQDEIAQEILERSLQKCPYTEPTGRDVIFAMKLAHRLATRIVPPDKGINLQEKTANEKSDHATPALAKLPVNASKIPTFSKTGEGNETELKKTSTISDKIELLKILEDDPDDIPELNQSYSIIDQKPKIRKSKSRASPLIKLHPELEKELALKQLQNFNQDQRRKKNVLIPEVLKKVPKQEGETVKKHHEHNNNVNASNGNNQTSLAKRKINDSSVKALKKIKKDVREAVTVDPSQITETLTVEGQDLVEEQSKDGKSLKQYSNKRLSRSSETPPRDVPIEILLNGVDDIELPQDEKDLSKNKIFKATNPRKRREELDRKRQKHFANVLQRNKPQKKRGRPPKKKVALPKEDILNEEFLLQATTRQKSQNGVGKTQPDTSVSNEEVSSSFKDEKPLKTKKMREIERLLGDEGAINMLYSVEQKRTTGSEPKRGMLPSYRRKKKDLILKTKLVKSAVLRLTTSPSQTTGRISLRGQTTKDEEENEESIDETSLRKMSVDSRDSHHSISSPPAEVFPFPAKIVPAEASRIIRRHSSSSNYSSRSNSPRRLSVDGERVGVLSPETKTGEIGHPDMTLSAVSKHNKHTKSYQQQSSGGLKKLEKVEKTERLSQGNKGVNLSNEVSKQTFVNSKKSLSKTLASEKCKSKVQFKQDKIENSVKSGSVRARRKLLSPEVMKKKTELNTSLAAAVDDFTKEIENVDKNIPIDTPKKLPAVPNSGVNTRTTSKIAVYSKSATLGRPRGTKLSVVYNELTLKRYNHLVEIILSPVSTKLKNAMNANVLRELVTVLNGLSKDENCRMVLITSSDNTFCQGIDIHALIQPTSEKRMAAALEMAVAIKDFIKALAMFSKPVVAGVQGPAVGLGTTMLPLFDFVFASDKATFHTPYAKLGQVPEGAATLSLPTLLGSSATSELLFACRKLTASEGHHFGLVTRILCSDNFHDELIHIIGTMASQSSQSMDATKALLRHNLLAGLETTLVSETHLLIQHWTGAECQANFTTYLQSEEQSLGLEKQPT